MRIVYINIVFIFFLFFVQLFSSKLFADGTNKTKDLGNKLEAGDAMRTRCC